MYDLFFKKAINAEISKIIGLPNRGTYFFIEYCDKELQNLVEYKTQPVSMRYYIKGNLVVTREKIKDTVI